MATRCTITRFGWLAVLSLVGRAMQAAPVARPHSLALEWGEVYLRTEAQFENECQTAGTPPSQFTRTQTTVEPALGLGVNGSIYHPDLFQFHLNTELGMSWENTRLSPGGSASSEKFLQRYHADGHILDLKPYASSLFADKDMVYRDYDFFSRVRVDSEQFGARSGYTAGPVPFNIAVQHYDETENNPSRPRDFRQDTLSFNAQNRRHLFAADSRLNYNVSEFTRHDDGFSTTRGVSHNLNFSDHEQFGARQQGQLTTLVNYSALTRTAVPIEQLLLQEDFRYQHNRKFDSYYAYLFNTSAAGDSDSITHDGRAGVNYQFRPDLGGGIEARGDITKASSPGSSLDTRNFGAGFNAHYSPELTKWLRLILSEDLRWDHDDRRADGLLQNIIGEVHTLTDGSILLLNQPNVAPGSIHVWSDTAHTIPFYEGSDYHLINHGALVEIQRNPLGTIPNGSTIYVDYTATLQGSATYNSYANNAAFRLVFCDGLLAIFGHWAVQAYDGAENLLLRATDSKGIGVEGNWRWFRVAAEYETVASDLAPYDRVRLVESAHFAIGERTDLSLNFDQGWTDFPDNNLHHVTYGFTARLQQQLAARLTAAIEGGMRMDRGESFERDLALCRLWLDWAIGKLTVRLTYEFNDDGHLSDQQERHYVFMRVRRDFR